MPRFDMMKPKARMLGRDMPSPPADTGLVDVDAVIAAGAVVTHDVPARSLAAGNPARVVGNVPADHAG